MNKHILNKEVQSFINKNLNENLVKLTLKGAPFSKVSIQEITTQIQGRLKAKTKLHTWFKTPGIYYPPKLHIEQTSSEITAHYKTDLVNGKTIADLTGGFGVDTFYFSKTFNQVSYFETNKDLSEIASHNFSLLSKSIQSYNQDGISAIEDKKFDVIYVDPSRRNETKGKVFFLSHCLPNITLHLNYLLDRCKTLMIKTSPMLDISAGLSELHHVYEIHIVSVRNEVKELIWLLEKDTKRSVNIVTVNHLGETKEVFEAPLDLDIQIAYSLPKKFLYEPNAALMKSGLYDALCLKYPLDKLAPSSHLFTSDQHLIFPGRQFEITKVLPYSKSEIKKEITGIQANISTRNFPETVSSLKAKWKIKDGGDLYLFFTTNKDGKKVILKCLKIKK